MLLKIHKKVLLIPFLILMLLPLYSQEIAEDEVKEAEPVEFTHFTGEYDSIDTLEEIIGIGERLAGDIRADRSGSGRFGAFRVIHSYQPEIEKGLDGDIFICGENSNIDHVKNLRRILAGYLSSVYKYSFKDAYLLAEFITYYNAVHYQDIGFFSEKYKSGVVDNLTPSECGLSRVYSEWPGKARIVIPLKSPGYDKGKSMVDTSSISDDEVIDVMREEEDDNLQERKDMVELREEENRKEEQAVEEKAEELEKKREEVEEKKSEIERKKDQIEDEIKEQEEEGGEESEKRAEELREDLKDLDKESEAVEEEESELEVEEKSLDERARELDEKAEEVLDMRDDVTKDENSQISEGTDDTEPEDKEAVFISGEDKGSVPVYFFHNKGVDDEGFPFGIIALYDINSMKKSRESTVKIIYGRDYTEFDSNFICVGKNRETGEVHLMVIDREALALVHESSEVIYPGSRIFIDKSNRIYAVVSKDGQWSPARFNRDLSLETISAQQVNPMTDILFLNGNIYVENRSGSLVELAFENLEPKKEFTE